MNQGIHTTLQLKNLKKHLEKYNHLSLCHVRVEDPKNKRWTDAWLSVTISRKGVKVYLTHEKGYPSQEKGIVEKSITLKWLSDELPLV